jgi:hypothetical protein
MPSQNKDNRGHLVALFRPRVVANATCALLSYSTLQVGILRKSTTDLQHGHNTLYKKERHTHSDTALRPVRCSSTGTTNNSMRDGCIWFVAVKAEIVPQARTISTNYGVVVQLWYIHIAHYMNPLFAPMGSSY